MADVSMDDKASTNEIKRDKDGKNKDKKDTKDVKLKNISPRKEKPKASERKPKTDLKTTEFKAEKSGINVHKDTATNESDGSKVVRQNVDDGPQASLKAESDGNKKEKMEFPCEACATEGISVESTNYCSECAENICGECVNQHRKFPAMKTHNILGKTSRRKSSSIKSENDEKSSQLRLLECESHPGKEVEMFCKHHDNVWCAVCMAVHHRYIFLLHSFFCTTFEYLGQCSAIILKNIP